MKSNFIIYYNLLSGRKNVISESIEFNDFVASLSLIKSHMNAIIIFMKKKKLFS